MWQRADKLENFRSLIKPAYFVPETKPLDDLLPVLQQIGAKKALDAEGEANLQKALKSFNESFDAKKK